MNGGARLLGYLLVLSALAALLVATPSAWATPEQSQSGQMTVPTRTPKPATPPPSPATDEPEDIEQPTGQPGNPPTLSPGTQVPTPAVATPATTPATPVAAARLTLKKEAAPAVVWPGATVQYTLTLTNRGTASARQIVIQDTLPDDLVPGAIAPGPDARWEGQTLQAQALVLPPGSQLVIVYTADVRVNARPGGVISNSASAAAAGNLQAAASTSVALPPAELPPTGGTLAGIRRAAASER
jgi:uncharacterized repeat protein (TIGR01451 family)